MSEIVQELTDKQLQEELKRRKTAKTEDRKTYKKLVQQELPNSVMLLQHTSKKLGEAKTEVFKNLLVLLDLKTKAYGVKSGQQSHTFSLDNGDTITAGYRVLDAWDDTVNEGITKVNEYLGSLAKDADSGKLVKTVNMLLKKDAKGNLKANRVVELRNMADEFDSPLFSDGVEIISKSFKPVKSVYFVEATVVTPSGEKQHVPLSISSVPFSSDIEINF